MRILRATLLAIATSGLLASEVLATAVEITPDYSGLGTVRIDADGFLVSSGGTDITTQFTNVLDSAITYWESAITHIWDIDINFSLADLGTGEDAAVGDALATSWLPLSHGVQHITEADIRFNNRANEIAYFVDPTPFANSEFDITPANAALGGGSVNVDRRGDATAAAAMDRWDLLTLALHEIEHALGFATVAPIFTAAVDGPPNRRITVDSGLSVRPRSTPS